jgi:hypothetical protein
VLLHLSHLAPASYFCSCNKKRPGTNAALTFPDFSYRNSKASTSR